MNVFTSSRLCISRLTGILLHLRHVSANNDSYKRNLANDAEEVGWGGGLNIDHGY
jgi:hypothetical protein